VVGDDDGLRAASGAPPPPPLAPTGEPLGVGGAGAAAAAAAAAAASAAAAGPVITLQRVDPADYNIVSCVKNPAKSRYECETQSGKKINVLLRWKNGNGIAFPAFQIS